MSRNPDKNFPGDSECSLGVVVGALGTTHVCQNCRGDGCKPRHRKRKERVRALSGSTIFTDQKGRSVYVNLETGACVVLDD
jgi:hypothetical protein